MGIYQQPFDGAVWFNLLKYYMSLDGDGMADTILNVLLVDDSLTQHTMVSDFLQVVTTETIEYHVYWASTYDEGINEITKGSYDVCLIDYELGNKNGLDFVIFIILCYFTSSKS